MPLLRFQKRILAAATIWGNTVSIISSYLRGIIDDWNSLRPMSYLGLIWDLYVLDLKTKVFVGKTNQHIFHSAKIVLIVWPKIPQMPQKKSAQKFGIFWRKKVTCKLAFFKLQDITWGDIFILLHKVSHFHSVLLSWKWRISYPTIYLNLFSIIPKKISYFCQS